MLYDKCVVPIEATVNHGILAMVRNLAVSRLTMINPQGLKPGRFMG